MVTEAIVSFEDDHANTWSTMTAPVESYAVATSVRPLSHRHRVAAARDQHLLNGDEVDAAPAGGPGGGCLGLP